MPPQFLAQYAQAGMQKQFPLYTAFVIDALSLPRLKDLALDVPGAQHWVIDLPNEANRKFVAAFRAKYKHDPSFYAAQAYDAAYFIDSAVASVKGDLTKKDEMRAEMRPADYASVRGPYKYGNNHFPVQNFDLQEAIAVANGGYTLATALTAHQDRYHDRCIMN
jgi:branched-chain amino acid transport system substrate-binding protein